MRCSHGAVVFRTEEYEAAMFFNHLKLYGYRSSSCSSSKYDLTIKLTALYVFLLIENIYFYMWIIFANPYEINVGNWEFHRISLFLINIDWTEHFRWYRYCTRQLTIVIASSMHFGNNKVWRLAKLKYVSLYQLPTTVARKL